MLKTAWELAQQSASFGVALVAIWAAVVRPWMKKAEKKRKIETAAREKSRKEEIVAQVEAVVQPIRDQVEAIHRTTHINGGKSNPPTLRDEVNNVGKQVETAIRAVGAVAVNQAYLSSRFDQHERDGEAYMEAARAVLEQQGIDLPPIPSSLPPAVDDDE